MENVQPVEYIMRSTLKPLGYFKIEIDSRNRTHPYFLADGNSRRIIVQVQIGEYPNSPTQPSEAEIKELKKIAENSNREAWLALIKINSEGELVDTVLWMNLSK